jgi:hypothetical protein
MVSGGSLVPVLVCAEKEILEYPSGVFAPAATVKDWLPELLAATEKLPEDGVMVRPDGAMALQLTVLAVFPIL